MGSGLRERLEASVIKGMTAASSSEMRWGVDDCCLWIADILAPVLGFDPAEKLHWRGGWRSYNSREMALSILGRRGVLGVALQCARFFGWKKIDPKDAHPGDVGLVKIAVVDQGKKRLAFASVICRKQGWFVGRNERGVTMIAASKVHRAWSVA